ARRARQLELVLRRLGVRRGDPDGALELQGRAGRQSVPPDAEREALRRRARLRAHRAGARGVRRQQVGHDFRTGEVGCAGDGAAASPREAAQRRAGPRPLVAGKHPKGVSFPTMKIRFASALFLLCTTPVFAAMKMPAGAPKHGFRAEFLLDFTDVSKKIVELAEAMPAAKYNWRPAPGVRS